MNEENTIIEDTINNSTDSIEELVPTPRGSKKAWYKKPVVTFGALGLVLVGAGFLLGKGPSSISSIFSPPEPVNLANVSTASPDAPVATVNGRKIKASEVNARIQNAATTLGLDVSKLTPQEKQTLGSEVLEGYINEILLIQDGEKAPVEVADTEVQTEYDAVVTQIGGEEQFKQQLAANNLTDETFRANIREQLVLQKHVNSFIGNVSVKPEEVTAYYESLKSQNSSIPPFEEVQDQATRELLTQKRNEALAPVLERLRASANIERYTETTQTP